MKKDLIIIWWPLATLGTEFLQVKLFPLHSKRSWSHNLMLGGQEIHDYDILWRRLILSA